MNAILEKARKLVEKARTSTGQKRANAVFECRGLLIDADFTPDILKEIGSSNEELSRLIHQGDKETAIELLEKARSSEGEERDEAAELCKEILKCQACKSKGIEAFTPEDIGTTMSELNSLISQSDFDINENLICYPE